jgi:hypothetical protein
MRESRCIHHSRQRPTHAPARFAFLVVTPFGPAVMDPSGNVIFTGLLLELPAPAVWPINADSGVPSQTVQSSGVVGLVSLAIHPGGSFIYAGSTNALGAPAGIFAFSVDPTTGALSLVPGSPFSPSVNSYFGGFNVPKALALDPSGNFYSQSASAKAACGLSQWTPRQEH